MAIIVSPEIRGQECSEDITYSYLFEPLRINVTETEPTATKLFVEIEIYNIKNQSIPIAFPDGSFSLQRYVEIDLVNSLPVTFDLSEVMIQLHDARVYKIATIADIELSYKRTVVSEYIYVFKLTTDKTENPIIIKKLPIIGGRSFNQFGAKVTNLQPLTEFEYYGLNPLEIANYWTNFRFFKTTLRDLSIGDNFQPRVLDIHSFPSNKTADAGVLIWKSRFGGWMFWGFDIERREISNSYEGSLEVSMFESTNRIEGDPYIPVDYVNISSSNTVELKALALSQKELLAVSGINSSPAIYYAENNSGKLELMRLASASTPYSSLANGGDFTVSLKSISKTSQKTA